MSLPRNQTIDWLKRIDIGSQAVLDLGAGREDQWTNKHTQGDAKEYWTSDVENFPGINIVIDLNKNVIFDGDLKTYKLDSKFDIVFCIEVFEHLYDPITAMQNIYLFLKEGGTAYISVPFINPIHDEVDYLRYTEEWFRIIANNLHFTACEIAPRIATQGNKLLQRFYSAEGMRMSKLRLKRGEAKKLSDVGYMVKLTK